MKNTTMNSYSAFVYEVKDRYMAECSMLRMVSSGITPLEAIENLKQDIYSTLHTSDIQIMPVFERR